MDAAQRLPETASQPAAARCRAALCYRVGGALRFLSHHDELRMLTRALTRAGWPLRYSAGFNPLPRLSLPLPRSTGMGADAQWAIVELNPPAEREQLWHTLAPTLPEGCHLTRLVAPLESDRPHPASVEYALDLEPAEVALVAGRARRLLALEQWPVERVSGRRKRPVTVDLRPLLAELEMEDRRLRLRLVFAGQRTIRVPEILTELGLTPETTVSRVRRGRVIWDNQISGPSVGPPAPEGVTFGKEDDEERG
jgi:radical SAM-linked protein